MPSELPEFQSSPAPEDRCNPPHAADCARCLCFNPHWPRRTGATEHVISFEPSVVWFQSSPAPEDRCNR